MVSPARSLSSGKTARYSLANSSCTLRAPLKRRGGSGHEARLGKEGELPGPGDVEIEPQLRILAESAEL